MGGLNSNGDIICKLTYIEALEMKFMPEKYMPDSGMVVQWFIVHETGWIHDENWDGIHEEICQRIMEQIEVDVCRS
jgi:hypothetical protein